MRLTLRLRLALAKAQLRLLLVISRYMGLNRKPERPMPEREFMYPHTCLCIDTDVSNYEFHYSTLYSDDAVNMLLSTILEEFIGEQITNDQVSIYRWVQDGTVEETIMELIFKYE